MAITRHTTSSKIIVKQNRDGKIRRSGKSELPNLCPGCGHTFAFFSLPAVIKSMKSSSWIRGAEISNQKELGNLL